MASFSFIDFQWEFDLIQRLEALITLKSQPSKLLLDFLLLICVCRQQNVFRIEQKYGGRRYPGGRNESSVKDVFIIMSGQLPIRTHDFLYPTNWLDILKSIVYFSSFWVTLSVVLLTGTNNVSAFSLGYLISSFLFCYIGTNFYMKPIRSILQWWNTLIAFNVFVIITKSILNLRLMLSGTFTGQQMVVTLHSFLNEVDEAKFICRFEHKLNRRMEFLRKLCFPFRINNRLNHWIWVMIACALHSWYFNYAFSKVLIFAT